MQLKIHLGSPLSLSSPSSTLLLITILIAHCICNHTLVFSIYDSTEDGIQKYRSKSKNAQGKQSRRRRGGINPANKRYLELQIKTLQNAHRDADKLRQRLKAKEREKQRETTQIEVTQKG